MPIETIRFIMEILNSLWTVGVITVIIILAIYCRYHFLRVGMAPHVRLGMVIGVLLMGDVVQRSTIFYWHHLFSHGIKISLDEFYRPLAIGCLFAITGIFLAIRVLSEAYWGWPACAKVSALVIVLAAALVAV